MKEIRKRKRENIHKIRESIQEEKKAIEESLPPIVRNTGGSIDNLNNKSLYFKKWVRDIQEKVNPLVGKHVTNAPEYTTDCLVLDQRIEELDDKLKGDLDKGTAEYDPEKDETQTAEDMVSPKKDEQKDKKFIDINIIENTTRRQVEKTNEEIEKSSIEQMKSYHDDPNYSSKISIPNVIENYRNILLIKKEEEKKYLKKD